MIVEYSRYTDLGYGLVPENEFARYASKAELSAEKYTFGRLNMENAEENISEKNLRGICELADLYYSDANQLNKQVMSYTNGNYGATYALPSTVTAWTTEEKAYDIITLYFTKEQLYRGVGGKC